MDDQREIGFALGIYMGYSGLTGRSGKLLATLAQYGLVEKAGKGDVRVTQRAVDILHPDPSDPHSRGRALLEAAKSSELFETLMSRFPDGVSENALQSFLTREGYAAIAIPPAVSSYLETCQFLRQENAYDSHGASVRMGPQSSSEQSRTDEDQRNMLNQNTNMKNLQPSTRGLPLGAMDPSGAHRLNTVRVTVDGAKLQIHGGVLDIKGLEKLRKELDAYKTLLELNAAEDDEEEDGPESRNEDTD